MLLQQAAGAAHPLAGTLAEWIWLVPLLPLLGFVVNGLLSLLPATHLGPADPSRRARSRDDAGTRTITAARRHHHAVRHQYAGIVSLVGPAVLGSRSSWRVAIFVALSGAHAEEPFVADAVRSWMPAGDLQVDAAFQLDQLSMRDAAGRHRRRLLIHLFSVGYMQDDPGYPRYFAYLNLFVFFMLVLVLGASYPVMFVGWEGVGLCSYLLIGFWFSDKANADAGKKAFIVNRIGDFGFLVAMFLLFAQPRARSTSSASPSARRQLADGRRGRHGDLPLPVPRLRRQERADPALHLAARRHGRPDAGLRADPRGHDGDRGRVPRRAQQRAVRAGAGRAASTVAVVGALTALFAATIGLKQWDIKKVLAYSTVSQLGYMFVGVGVGAYAAGVFHLVTHAFFKALLFLGSGSVIYAMHHALSRTRTRTTTRRTCATWAGCGSTCRVTFGADVDRDARDRRHPAVRGLLLEGRDPRRRSSRARTTRRWPRRTGSASRAASLLYAGLRARPGRGAADRVYMTRDALHLPRPEPHRRGGARAPARGAVDHDRPAGRARRAQRGRRLAQPAGVHRPLGPTEARSTGSSRWSASRALRITHGEAAHLVASAPSTR